MRQIVQSTHIQTFTSPRASLYLFLFVHFTLWTWIPVLVRRNLPLDVVEGIAWGSQWQWGYYKHPFLAPWLTQLGALLSPHSGWAIYAVSQLAILCCMVAIWRLSLKISNPLKALYSVMLLEGVLYNTLTSPEFNPNVLMIATWSLAYLWFYNALTQKRLIDWSLAGLTCGLTIVSKYYSGALLLSMLIFLLFYSEARQSFKSYGPYIALLVFLCTIAPNIYWLYQHDFISIHYAFDRAASQHTLSDHLFNSIHFLSGQLLNLLPAIFLFALILLPGNVWVSQFRNHFDRVYIQTFFWCPILITLGFSIITGDQILDMWGTPLFSLVGVLFVHSISDSQFSERKSIFIYSVYLLMGILIMIYALAIILAPMFKHHGSREYFPGKHLADQVTEIWRRNFASQLNYVIGNTWLSSNVAFYSKDKPQAYLNGNAKDSPWIDHEKLQRDGAVVLWQQYNTLKCSIPSNYKQAFPDLKCQSVLHLSYQSTAKNFAVNIGVGVLPPKQD